MSDSPSFLKHSGIPTTQNEFSPTQMQGVSMEYAVFGEGRSLSKGSNLEDEVPDF